MVDDDYKGKESTDKIVQPNKAENPNSNEEESKKETAKEPMQDTKQINEQTNKDRKEIYPPDLLKFCPNCGAKIKWAPKTYYCENCGTMILKYIPESEWEIWLADKIDSSKIKNNSNRTLKVQIDNTQIGKATNYYTPSSAFVSNDEQTEYLKRFLVKKRRFKKNQWNAKNAIIAPLVAVFGKIGILILLLIVLFLLRIISINQIASLDPTFTQILTLIDFSTQYIFIAVAFFFLRKSLGSDIKPIEVFGKLGLPFDKIKFNFALKQRDKKDIINLSAKSETENSTELSESFKKSGASKQINAFKEIVLGVLFGILMFFLILLLQEVSFVFVKWIWGDSIEQFVNENSSMGIVPPENVWILVLVIIIQFLVIAPSEEILFRGYSQEGFKRSWGKHAGIIATAFYFALFHIIIYIPIPEFFMFLFIPYMSLSLFLGYLYEKRGNLISNIVAHALYNSIQFVILFMV